METIEDPNPNIHNNTLPLNTAKSNNSPTLSSNTDDVTNSIIDTDKLENGTLFCFSVLGCFCFFLQLCGS